MKIKLDLTNYKLELLDQTPFIQGSDTVRNKIEVYVLASVYSSISNPKISYTYPSGRSSIAIGNNGASDATLDSTSYKNIYFNLPDIATAEAGQLMATLVLTLTSGTAKFNITNMVLKSSDFETFNNALTGTAAEVMADLAAKGTAIQQINSEIGTDPTANTIKGRITALESNLSTEESKLASLNTEVFGESTGTNPNSDGLKYIVRTNHEGRIDALENINAGTRLTTLEGAKLGYIELSSNTGTLTDAQISQVTLNNCVINYNGRLYKKHYVSSASIVFVAYDMLSQNDTTFNNARYIITITISGSTYNYVASSRSMTAVRVADVVNNLTSTDTNKPLSAAQGKALKDALDTLSNYIYQGNANDAIDRLSEIFAFLTGHDDDETLDAILAGKADKSTTYTKTEDDTLLAAKEDKTNKVTSFGNTPSDTNYPSEKLVKDSLDNKEATSNKVTSWSDTTTDTHYPSEKLVKDSLDLKANSNNVYTKQQTYSASQVDAIIEALTINGYEISWEVLCDIYNLCYASDPLMTMLDSINGEVV